MRKMPHQSTRSSRRAFKPETYQWEGVEDLEYKAQGADSSWTNVVRRHLAGQYGENVNFHLRYFELEPGGKTSWEHHQHEHVVIGVRGEGVAMIEGEEFPVRFMDIIYVAPGATHQFVNCADQPFGFLCLVDAERDRPVSPSMCELPEPLAGQK